MTAIRRAPRNVDVVRGMIVPGTQIRALGSGVGHLEVLKWLRAL